MTTDIPWSELQKRRLQDLNGLPDMSDSTFASTAERDASFKKQERLLTDEAKTKLNDTMDGIRRPALCQMESILTDVLIQAGFTQVTTPVILPKSMLAKMTIDDEHALSSQVFWLDEKRCLRPMLAPNLYVLLKDLVRLRKEPVKIFEIGSCFRKESQSSRHLNEFTMLNLVEWGLEESDRHRRLEEYAQLVMDAAGINDVHLEHENSVVYGDTIDVMQGELELGSGAMGPHFLDGNWGMTGAWVGIGFGLERLTMVHEGSRNVRSVGKSISYFNGVRLNL